MTAKYYKLLKLIKPTKCSTLESPEYEVVIYLFSLLNCRGLDAIEPDMKHFSFQMILSLLL